MAKRYFGRMEVNSVSFAFNRNESEGTIKYFLLAFPIIDALDYGKRIVTDEPDSKHHPPLVKRIVTLFNNARTNPKGHNFCLQHTIPFC